MVKKHPVLCWVLWFLVCCLVVAVLELGGTDFARLLFIVYLWDKGSSAISEEFYRKEK